MSTESGIEVQRSELEKMDRALVEAGLLLPGVLSHEQYTKIRYALSLARLSSFQPGAAVSGARNDRPDVVIDESWAASLRQAVRETLKPILLDRDEPGGQLVAAREWLEQFRGEIATTRTRILQAHSEDFSVAELDAEIEPDAEPQPDMFVALDEPDCPGAPFVDECFFGATSNGLINAAGVRQVGPPTSINGR